MLIALVLRLRQANETRRRLARTRNDTEHRPPRYVMTDRASKPRRQNEEAGCGD